MTNTGEQVPIYGGLRLVGRMESWDVGVLNMQTQDLDSLPSENFGALRLRKQVFNPYSYIGGMFTSRLDGQGHTNLAYGIDGVIKVSGDDFLTLQWAQTFDNEEQLDGGLGSGRLAVEMNRRRRQGFGYTAGIIYSGPDYNPGIGFVDRRDFTFGSGIASHTWLRPSGPFIWHKAEITGSAYLANANGDVLSSEAGAEWSFTTRGLDNGAIGITRAYENLLEDFALADNAVVPVGTYDFLRVAGNYNMSVDKRVRTSVSAETGTFYDGWLHTLGLSPSWYVSKYLQLDLDYTYNYGTFADRGQLLNFHLARLRVGTALDRHISTNAFVQYNGADDLFAVNVRFRWNFREGQDLWIVFNSGLNTDRRGFTPTLPSLQNRSFLLKYTHTFLF